MLDARAEEKKKGEKIDTHEIYEKEEGVAMLIWQLEDER